MPVIVRNNTNRTVASIDVTATIRDESGKLIATGSSQGLHPTFVRPGQVAVGYVFIDVSVRIPAGSPTEVEVIGSEPDPSNPFSEIDLLVEEANHIGNHIVGVLRNATNQEVTGPISVGGVCFNSNGSLKSDFSTFAEKDSIAAGGTSSFSVDLFEDPCPSFLLGGSGYSS